MPSYTLIRGGQVLTLDAQLGTLPRADVLVDGGRVAAIGPDLDPPDGAAILDATGMLVAPGLVDNHRHLWVTLLRGFSVDHRFGDYFQQVLLTISPKVTPDDVYLGGLLGAYEALDTGVTTILDWNHATNTPEHAFAAVRALRESGIRGVFGYSSPATGFFRADSTPAAGDLDAIWQAVAEDPLVSIAVGTRNPENADEPGLRRIADDIGHARRLGVPVTMHTGFGGGRSAPGWLAEQGLLGPDTTLVHGNAFTADELRIVAQAGGWLTVSPDTELQMGLGAPPLRAMLDAGLRPTVSVDVVATAAGDLRTQLRMLLQTQRLLDHAAGREGPLLPWRDGLAWVTANPADSLGLAGTVGRLAPGYAADLVLIDRSAPGVAPAAAAELVAMAAPAAAVDTVLVGGRVVKRAGRLVDVDLPALRRQAELASQRLLSGA